MQRKDNKGQVMKIEIEKDRLDEFGKEFPEAYKCFLYFMSRPERSKREDYNYKCLELDGNSSVDFVEIKRVKTKLEAENWVDEKPHLRTWHEFVDAVL